MFLITILTIVMILFICLNNTKNKNVSENYYENNLKIHPKKKVRFDLNNNKIYNLNTFSNYKKEKIDEIKPITTKSIVNKKPEFESHIYGNQIMRNSSFFIDKHIIPDFQNEFVEQLEKEEKINNDIFANQKPYWKSLDISDYTFRTFDNENVQKINQFKNDDTKSEKISNVYNYLTGSFERDLANNFSKEFSAHQSSKDDNINQIYSKPLRHNDNYIFNNFNDKYYGYQNNCENIEKLPLA